MNTGKKRILSFLLAMCMTLSLLPVSAWAATETENDHGDHSGWTALNSYIRSNDTLTGGSYYLTGDLNAGTKQIKVTGTVNLCLNGHTYTSSAEDGIFLVGANGVLNIYDCKGNGGISASSIQNPVFLVSGGVCNLYGGTLQSNRSVVVIDDNDKGDYTGGTFNMYGGTVRSNATNDFQGIKINAGLTATSVNIYGGTIRSGRYGINAASGTVKLCGDLGITGDTADIYLSGGAKIIPEAPLSGEVGVDMETPGVFTAGDGANYQQYFYSDKPNYVVIKSGNELMLGTASSNPHTHCVCGEDNCTDAEHGSEVTFAPLSSLNSTIGPGNYYLTKNLTNGTNGHITVSGNVTLCLNGRTLDLNGKHIIVPTGSSLTLCDCGSSGEITGQNYTEANKNGNGSVYVLGGSFTMYSGAISGNKAYSGGGVNVNGGSFTMYGGTISGNTAQLGGGVSVISGSFTMHGGTISNNKASTFGYGGVYVSKNGIFTMYDGSITNNQATGSSGGGGVHIEGSFTMSGGAISDNAAHASSYGGGVHVAYGGSFTLSDDASITGNTSGGSSCNVYLGTNAVITIAGQLTGGKIGVRMASPGVFTSGWTSKMGNAAPTNYFSSEDSAYLVERNSDGEAMLHQHSYTYTASGGTITETCTCGHSATASVNIPAGADLTYTGNAIEPAMVQYSTDWLGGTLTPTYKNNTNVGTAAAEITKGGATASVNFTITRAGQTPPGVGEGYTIDYTEETITVLSGYEVYTAQEDGSKIESGVKVTPGETYYIRRAETTTQEASEFTAFTVAERPATPAAPNVTGKTDTSITISTESGCEYAIGEADNWISVSGSEYTFTGLTPGTDYTISVRVPATASTFASAPSSTIVTTKTATAEAPAAPPESAITVTDGSITVTGSVSGQEYAVLPAGQQPQEDDWQAGGGDLTFNNLDYGTQYVVWTRTEETEDAMPSQASTVSVTTAAKTPDSYTDGVTVDYAGETINVNPGYEISTDAQNWSDSAAFEPGETYYVRVEAQGGVPASASVSFTTASRPAAPGDEVIVTGESVKGKGDGSVSVPEGMEYSTGGENWVSGPATLTGLPAGTTVTVRVQATATAPHGEEQTYTVQDSDVTLTVTFDEHGGSGVTDITGLSYNSTITAPDITRAGYTLDGWYNGDAKWDFENGQVTADLTLTAKWTLNAPTVTLTASDDNVIYGEKITLTAAATHAASVTYAYEWYKGGEKLDGKADSTLTIENVNDSGSYNVKVTASDGTLTSAVEKSIQVSIGKATPTLSVSAAEITYGQSLSNSQLAGTATHNNQDVSGTFAWQTGSINPKVSDSGVTGYTVVFTPTDTANYNSAEAQVTVSVAKKTLMPSVASVQDKVYDGDEDTTGIITLTGAVLGDQPTASGVFTFENANAGMGKTVKVTVTLGDGWASNYVLAQTELTATADVTPKTVGLKWNGYDDLVYSGEPVSVSATATGLVNGDQCAVTVENGAQTDAGTYTAEAKSLNNPNYQLPTEGTTQSYTIAPRPVELSWSASSFTYDGSEKTVTATITNLVPDDVCALTYEDNAKTGHGSYTAKVTALDNANYTLTNGTNLTHSWSIGKAVVSFTVTGNSHTYDGEPKTAEVTQDEGQTQIPAGGYEVKYGGEASQTAAGTYDITVTITNGNFCFAGDKDTMVVGKLSIGKQAVEIPAADDTEFTYNGAEQTYAIAESELYTVEGNVQKNAGTYTVTVALKDKANYVWPDGTTDDRTYTFIISPKTVTATWVGLEQVYGSVEPVYVILSGLAEGDEDLEAVISGVSTEAGEHPLNASLKNYDIINGTATLRIQQKPVTITVTDNAVTVGSEPAISAPGLAESDYEVVYKDKNGNEVTPSEPGTYEVWVEITNPNYRHPDGSSLKQVGSIVVSSGTPRTYEVSFAGSGAGGSTAGMKVAGGSAVILPECGFTKPGSVFTGWKYGGVVYKPGDSFTMPYADITITAQWTQARNVSGTVKDEYGVPVPGAAVSIWQGSDKLGETTTGPDGSYSFTGLAPGSYNVSASVGEKTVTSVVTVDEGGAVTGGNIILPEGNTSTRVEITPGSPDLVVGELDRVFDNTDGEDYTAADAETVKNGGMVEITFTADEKKLAEVRDELQQLQSAGDVNLSLFLDCTLEKEVYDSNGTKDESASGFISRSSVLLEVRLPLPTEMQGKYGYSVSRIHEGEAQALSTSANSLGEYFEVSADKSALILHVCCFSIYAVGYENSPVLPPLPTENAPNVSESEHGSVTVFPNLPTTGTVVTITPKPDEGYTVDKVTVTDASGKAVEVSPNGDGTYSFTQPSGAVTITVTFKVLTDVSECPRDASCPMSGYTDLNMGEWYHDGIHYCLDEGLMDGVDAGMFAPNATTSRAMIVTILWRLQGSPEVDTTETFTDVYPDAWYAKAIAWAVAEGVADGYGEGLFGPNDAITREQLAAMLWRYAARPESEGGLSAFVDGAEVSVWAQQAMSWAVSLGLINGVDSDRLDPKGQATRAQTATILMRFAQSMTR